MVSARDRMRDRLRGLNVVKDKNISTRLETFILSTNGLANAGIRKALNDVKPNRREAAAITKALRAWRKCVRNYVVLEKLVYSKSYVTMREYSIKYFIKRQYREHEFVNGDVSGVLAPVNVLTKTAAQLIEEMRSVPLLSFELTG